MYKLARNYSFYYMDSRAPSFRLSTHEVTDSSNPLANTLAPAYSSDKVSVLPSCCQLWTFSHVVSCCCRVRCFTQHTTTKSRSERAAGSTGTPRDLFSPMERSASGFCTAFRGFHLALSITSSRNLDGSMGKHLCVSALRIQIWMKSVSIIDCMVHVQ